MGTVNSNGTSILFIVDFTGFPSSTLYDPFVYHIHNLPVSSDWNSTSTLSHFGLIGRGGYQFYQSDQPETCQAGDLAGKL